MDFDFDDEKDEQPEIQGTAVWVSSEAGATSSPIGMQMIPYFSYVSMGKFM